MKMNEYQELAQKTANKKLGFSTRLPVAALGLVGEAGEYSEGVKKFLGHGHGIDRENAKKELGDVLWYVQENAHLLELTLEEIAVANIEKLAQRYPDGFSEWRSQNRKE